MLDFHEGKRLKTLVELMIKKGRRSGAVLRFVEKLGLGDHSALRYHYSQERLKGVFLKKALEALGITEEEFFNTEGRITKSATTVTEKVPEGSALLTLIENRGIEKSWLASQLDQLATRIRNYGNI